MLVAHLYGLKPVPFISVRAAPTGLRAFVVPYPTLKRGANNLCAYGAFGTAKAAPYQPCPTVPI